MVEVHKHTKKSGRHEEKYTGYSNIPKSGLKSLFVCLCEVLRPNQQLRSCQAGQLPVNTIPGQA